LDYAILNLAMESEIGVGASGVDLEFNGYRGSWVKGFEQCGFGRIGGRSIGKAMELSCRHGIGSPELGNTKHYS